MDETTINAIDVREGQTVTRVLAKSRTIWRDRPCMRDQDVRQVNGQWPTVVHAEYIKGADLPVLIETSDKTGWSFYLEPDDQVTVQAAG